MNCETVRQRLLASERPDQPDRDESRHLAHCRACHIWLKRLVRLERELTRLPVPDCPVPVALLERIGTETPGKPLVRPPLLPASDRRRVREGGRQKLALAISLAATLALFTLAWWAWPPRDPAVQPLPGVAPTYSQLRDKRLREANTPGERVLALARLADDFLLQIRDLGNHPEQAASLAEDFHRLVQTDLFEQAQAVPVHQRPVLLLPLAARLRQANSEASRLAADWSRQFPRSVASVQRMADAAAEADRRLRLLVGA